MINVIMRRIVGAAVIGVVGLLAVPAASLAASTPAATTNPTSATTCAVAWGSTPKVDPALAGTVLTGVRAGRHACFDRLVIDLAGPATGYTVRYVAQVSAPGSGAPVTLRGGARVLVDVHAATYDPSGDLVYRPRNPRELVDVAGYRTFRQVAMGGSFEGQTTIGLGVRARLPLRVMLLDAPGERTKLVIDVAHRW